MFLGRGGEPIVPSALQTRGPGRRSIVCARIMRDPQRMFGTIDLPLRLELKNVQYQARSIPTDKRLGRSRRLCVLKACHATGSIHGNLPPFIREALRSGTTIRLFELSPGGGYDPITRRLIAQDLNQIRHPFHVLSYTWGGEANPHRIETDEKRVL